MTETIDGSDSARNPLEILAAEFSEARRSGQQPSIDEYVNRLPEQREEARALLESIALFERVSEQEVSRQASQRRSKRFDHKKIEQLGDYRILREIGRGGMGVIYEAEQITLKRRVALKVLSSGTSESAKQLERFQREAEAVARLHHPISCQCLAAVPRTVCITLRCKLIDGDPLSHLPDLSFLEIAGSVCKRPARWLMRTAMVCCIATSSLRTCYWIAAAKCGSPISDWPS